MSYLRNVEIKKEIIICCIAMFAGMILGYLTGGLSTVIVVALIEGFFICFHFLSSYYRYRRISELSEEINRFLHGHEDLQIGKQTEGELSVLENEIQKMVLRLQNQADLLKQDKVYLSNSIADISHQIRTPLTSVNLIVSRLSVAELSEKNRRKLVKELESILVHIDWLIQALLTISKLDAGTISMKHETVSVRELIRQVESALEIPMELKEQKLEVYCEEEVTYLGDLKWFKEALLNILKNCTEHTPEQGCIWIEASENTLYTEIIVRDNGPGIAPEDLPHLFERFYKGKNSSDKSIGIGLALARMIVAEQNGSLTAENDRRGGARFVIRFYKSIV